MTKVSHAAPAEEPSDDLGGYRQELRRTLGAFQVFAISFAFISVAACWSSAGCSSSAC